MEPRRTPMKAPRRPQGGQRDTSGMGHVEYAVFSKQNQGSKPKVTIFNVNQGGVIKADNASRPEGIYSLGDIVRAQKEQQWSPEEHP